jgi:hypothetical protein
MLDDSTPCRDQSQVSGAAFRAYLKPMFAQLTANLQLLLG